jgi:hypothetical protein
MNDGLSIRITHRAAQDCNPAETTIDIGKATEQPHFSSLLGSIEPDALVPADASEMADALAQISRELGCANTLDDMLHAIDALSPPRLEWSATLCNGERAKFAAAEKACAALGEGWRLPTRAELLSLVDDTRSDPAIDTERFPDTKSAAYWTGTPFASDSSYAWIVQFRLRLRLLRLPPRQQQRLRACGAVRAGRSVTRPF